MSIRHLDRLFDPASVAVIGASPRAGSVGATVWRNLRAAGFTGPRWAVNLKHREIEGEAVHARIADLPAAPDLAVICTPPATVPGLVAELGARGTRAAVVLTAGLTPPQKQAMLDAAKVHLLRILGPNGLGLLSPAIGLNASFAHAGVGAGGLAFVSQSGALVSAMLDWAKSRGIGLSRVVSLGEQADVDFGDMLDWLASDATTRAVLLYVESLSHARKFMSAARAAARNKPVLVVKAGRSAAGQQAAASHTGALAGSDLVIDAAIRRAGMLRVDTLAELFVAAEALAHFRRPQHGTDLAQLERITIVTNGGGAGVLAADEVALRELEPAPLPEALKAELEAVLPPNWSHANPVDLIGDAPVLRYVGALQALLAWPETGTLLFIHAPTAIVPSAEIAAALLPLAQRHPARLVSCWLGADAVREARRCFHDAGIPTYDTPEQAVRALAMLATYRCNQELLLEAPPAEGGARPIDGAAVRALVDGVLAAGREMLSEPEAKALLAACGIATVATRVVAPDAESAARVAREIGYPVVLKILSPQVSHKSDVGGVALDLANAREVRSAASAMLRRVAAARPDAHVEGFTLQPMVRRPQALELIAGTHVDPVFGPVILFGAGGTRVEVVADRALALPPLNAPLARALIGRTRIARLLAGWRDVPAADRVAIEQVLIALSQLLADEPRIAELDINPLLADAAGVIALDARVRVSAAAPGGASRFAIRPYPQELVERFDWRGREVTMRPIRPEDEAQHLAFLERIEPADIRMRLFYTRRSIERSELARLTQIDYEREMAFVVAAPLASGGEETLGVVRAFIDPDNVQAEFGILIRSDTKGAGLGRRLMNKLIAHLRARATQRLVATVLAENAPMLQLVTELGFVVTEEPIDPAVRRIELDLR
ncbi:MAG TPA: bifunctional acetate--CoA ligase family protein/GNAT family N-acetyltransferase [Burkholderiaceae bacterium]|nr:bifunctional acetate--CoA ligase family protein/GNAT family N-acetyltransferase [Burkholderiaceae bacterium]